MSTADQSKWRITYQLRCFAPDELNELLLRRENPVTVSRVVLAKRTAAPRYLGCLARQKAVGGNIYVVASPLRSGTRKRKKESVALVRHLYLDLDSDGEAKLAAVQHSDESSEADGDRL